MSYRNPIAMRIADSFFRHRWLFLAVFLVVTGVTMGALLMRTRSFEAMALTQVVTDDVAAELGQQQRNVWTTPAQQNVSHFDDLSHDDQPGGFLDTALKNANLALPIDVDPKKEDPRYAKLRKGLKAAVQSDTLFAISLSWDNAEECEKIVTSLQRQYIDEVGIDKAAQGIATTRFLDSQIQSDLQRMRRAEQILIDYKQKNSGNLPEQQNSEISQYSNLKAQRETLLISQQDSALKKEAIQRRLAQIQPMVVSQQQTAESPLARQINDLKAKRDVLELTRLPNHPSIVNLNVEIANLTKKWQEKYRAHSSEAQSVTDVTSLQNPEYVSLQQQLVDATITQTTQAAQLGELSKAIADYEVHIKAMPEQQRTLTDKTRDYSILKEEYENLLKKREEIKMKTDMDKVSASSTLSRIGLVYAEPMLTPAKKILMLIGSLVLGLIIGIMLVILSEWWDRSLRYPLDTERLLGVPVLAVIPETSELRLLPESRKPKLLSSSSG